MSSKSHILVLLLVIVVVLMSSPALANMIVYADRAAFDAAVGPYTLITEDSPHTTTLLFLSLGLIGLMAWRGKHRLTMNP
jgi:hypothetical protein